MKLSLNGDSRALLRRARIGMLALNAGQLPLVTPAAFHFGGSALWMTTSRQAVKVRMAHRDPRAAFLVESGRRSFMFQGLLDIFDPFTIRGPLRAILEGPGFAANLAGYTLKNAPFVAGYFLDLASIPREWWPHNRVLLRLRPSRVQEVPLPEAPVAEPARLPRVPAAIARAVARDRLGQLCWSVEGSPYLAPAVWAVSGTDALAWLPSGAAAVPAEGTRAALVVERHHAFRATRMQGACLRGRLLLDPAAAGEVASRYESELAPDGLGLRLSVERVTWWRGFQVQTAAVEAPVG